jgi:Family of unknown function (DUF6064)
MTSLPFSREQLLDVFAQYNRAIGIAPLILILLAAAMLVVLFTDVPWRSRAVAAGLGLLWLWSGVIYHLTFFRPINSAATLFGALFALQGVGFLYVAARGKGVEMRPGSVGAAVMGWALIVYAMLVYPIVGMMLGHSYPAAPTFGAPCPVAIFTLGVLTWNAGNIPRRLFVIPLLWAVVGTSAAIQLDMREDFGLVVAGLVALVAVLHHRARGSPSALPAPES